MFITLVLFLIIPNSIVVDGTLHRNQVAAYYKDFSSISHGVSSSSDIHLAIDSVFVAKDTQNLYVRVFNPDTLWLGDHGDLFVAIDTGDLGGGEYSPLAKHVVFSGNLPDYVFYVNDNNDCKLLEWNDSIWLDTGTPVLCAGAGSHPDFELSLPLTSINSPSGINLSVYTTYAKAGDGIVDYSVKDSTYASVILDGNRDAEYIFMGSSDQTGGDGADLDSLFVTWDSLNLYIFLTTLNSASWDVAYGFALDVDQVPQSGYYTGESDAWGRHIDFGDTLSAEPFAPDYEIYFWWSGSDGAITSSNLCKWNGSAFDYNSDISSFFAYQGGSSGLKTLEIKIPWDSIGGVHPEILISAWVAGGNNSSAVDAIPHDDQVSNNNGTEWDDNDTIFTYVLITPDKPVIQDANSSYTSGAGVASDTLTLENNVSLSTSLITFGYYDYSNWGDQAVGFLYPIDGIVDTGGFYEDEMLSTSDSKNAWLTWNSDSIYVGYTYQAFDEGYGGDGDLFVYFQTDSISSISPYSDRGSHYAVNWWSGDTIILPMNMDYALAIEDGSYYALYKFIDSTGVWETVAQNTDSFPGVAFVGYDNTTPENGVTEVSLALSALGNPDYLGVLFFAHTDNTGFLYGISPYKSNSKWKTLNNNDGINDTLYHFWGMYRTGESGLSVNSIEDYYLPTEIDEATGNNNACMYVKNGILYVNSNFQHDEVCIYSVSGRLVMKKRINKGKTKITINTLPDGIYFGFLRNNRVSIKFVTVR